jgi:hypothetical protein
MTKAKATLWYMIWNPVDMEYTGDRLRDYSSFREAVNCEVGAVVSRMAFPIARTLSMPRNRTGIPGMLDGALRQGIRDVKTITRESTMRSLCQ